jgi:hypothetical protein
MNTCIVSLYKYIYCIIIYIHLLYHNIHTFIVLCHYTHVLYSSIYMIYYSMVNIGMNPNNSGWKLRCCFWNCRSITWRSSMQPYRTRRSVRETSLVQRPSTSRRAHWCAWQQPKKAMLALGLCVDKGRADSTMKRLNNSLMLCESFTIRSIWYQWMMNCLIANVGYSF